MRTLDRSKITGWNESTNNYSISGPVTVVENCYAWIATNKGDTIVTVNGKTLFPSTAPATEIGDSYAIGDPDGHVFKGNIKVQFDFPANANPVVEICQLYYLTTDMISPIKV